MEQEIYIDKWLAENLDILKINIRKDWDFWIICDGLEGSGKSTLTTQAAAYCDPDFHVSRVAFTPEQFAKAVDDSKQYQAVVWDEAVTGTQSTDLSRMARTLKSKAVQMRQKNLFVFLVMHSYFDMAKYYAVHRSWFLLHTYFTANEKSKLFERGYFSFYDFKKKNIMYLNDKYRKNYDYGLMPNFRGRFTKKYGIDEMAYRLKKASAATDALEGITKEKESIWLDVCIWKGMRYSEIKEHFSGTERWFYMRKKALNEGSGTNNNTYTEGEEIE